MNDDNLTDDEFAELRVVVDSAFASAFAAVRALEAVADKWHRHGDTPGRSDAFRESCHHTGRQYTSVATMICRAMNIRPAEIVPAEFDPDPKEKVH